jgi:hypothetical protein
MKYINNDPTQGINYDWKKIMNFYKKLGVPPDYDYSNILPLDKPYKWHLLLSVKSVGKTTQVLLIGLIMYKLYGTCIQIVRHHMDNAAYYDRLFKLINSFDGGRYLKAIFGEDNLEIGYYSKFFHVYKRKENGKREKYYPEPCAVALGSDECYTLCSKYDAPTGDLILLDECFTNTNRPDEFLNFINLHKTIVRERMSDKIFVLGNTYDANNIWFRQLTIAREIRGLKPNDQKIMHTVDGMPIFVYYLTPRSPEKRMIFNKTHYGFGNPQLNAITGAGAWNSKIYPLALQLPARKSLCRGLYFKIYDDLYLECEYLDSDLGNYFFIHPARISSAQMSQLVYTNTFVEYQNEIIFGFDKVSQRIITAIRENRIVFSDNESGNLFEKFINDRK